MSAARRFSGRQRQRGIALLLYATGALAVIGSAGLALDLGMAYIARSRLQNALDAAALSGAWTLNTYFDAAQATAEAKAAFALNAAGLPAGIVPTVETSATLSPWAPGGLNALFLKVSVTGMASPVLFASVLPGVGQALTLGGTAVAGPIPLGGRICDAVPIAVCGTGADRDCSDGACYGLTPGVTGEIEIKSNPGSLGAGNYGLVGCQGAACREAMAGGTDFCFDDGGTVETQPGSLAGPTSQGLNTRFGVYKGGLSEADYPPDKVTLGGAAITYEAYRTMLGNSAAWQFPDGKAQRRVLTVPIAQCDPPVNGKSSVPILGAACMLLTREVEAGNGTVYARIAPTCLAAGGAPADPGAGTSGPMKITLYQDTAGGA